MASEIRVNTINNRSGLGTVNFTDSGVIVSGVVTATSFSGDGSSLTGIDATQIVTGNTSVQTVDTGSDGHVKVTTEGTERVRINSSGNIGIGTVPQSWSGFRSIQLGGTTSIWSVEGGQAGSSFYSNNIYYDGSNRRYLTNNSASEYIQDASTGNHIFYEASSGTAGNTLSGYTEIARFTSDGLKLPDGSGIDFSARTPDSSGTVSSELLDDYEEGTYTPVLSGGGYTYTSGSYTAGRYTKVGRIVTVEAHFNISAISGSSDGSSTRITLPFAPSHLYTAGRWCQVLCRLAYFNASAIQRVYCAQLTTNSSSADIVYYYTSSGNGTDQPVNIGADYQSASNNGQIAFTMTYATAS